MNKNESWANRYRPKSWDALIGQPHIRKILENQLATDNIKHAYLFCGGAGTGKTTSARIVANLINEGKGRPIELDCASKNGVEDVRDIIEESKHKPFDCKYKIFIMDECHMLSTGANNALLKILEEPPEWVIFIFCTTDPQKVIGTIHSRVQKLMFKKVSVEDLVTNLKRILSGEGITTYTDEALSYIARLAKGGVRDSITTLEKCYDYNHEINLQNVLEATSGGITEDMLMRFLELVYTKNAKEAILELNNIYMSGIDMALFDKLFKEFIQGCIIYLITNNEDITSLSENAVNILKQGRFDRVILGDMLNSYNNKSGNLLSDEMKIMIEGWIIRVCF
ncbi:DNA polymerase III subunit gamma/tau [uncultured Clostridium sp.]|uniref:DNA polymerase III subunit gamma/tau n=1 Tax=uncultured Clostridium sp. TaxID=59620 RepID=UPI0026F2B0C8|nr:DNA polymerase III subunit gamma/tau [uncultured Clostridium sp.]